MMHPQKTITSIFLLLLITYFCSAQKVLHNSNIKPIIKNLNGEALKLPWTGGMHTCIIQGMDLNFDNTDDLLVFDKAGDRILPFIYTNGFWQYEEEIANKFPPIKDWLQCIDYNGDGKKDLFCYTIGGIQVWKNNSQGALQFELASPLLYSKYYAGLVNLFALPSDFPSIVDIDGDGDLDILNFWTLGVYIDLHQNMSMELYGHADSLVFVQTEHCWGKFTESEESNILSLSDPDCLDNQFSKQLAHLDRHSGSSCLIRDLNNDGRADLVLGDLDFPGLIKLINGNENIDALMIEQQHNFPKESEAVKLLSCPSAIMLDTDQDGIDELIATPSDEAWYKNENQNHIWRYENTGNNEEPNFQLAEKEFLVSEMIQNGSSSYPIVFDWDKDGLKDLFISNYGIMDSSWYSYGYLYNRHSSTIQYYQNTGSAYQLISKNFGNIFAIHQTALYPAFFDEDLDGDFDIICGNKEGNLLFFKNTGSNEVPLFELISEDYQQLDCGSYSAPQLFDFDEDGLLDLLVGNQDGFIRYFRNTGTAGAPNFQLSSERLGNVETTNSSTPYFGHCIPHFFINDAGERLLLCGSASGKLFLYNDIGTSPDEAFHLISDDAATGNLGEFTAPALLQKTDDELMKFAVGNLAGGLYLQTYTQSLNINTSGNEKAPLYIYPNPCNDYLRIYLKEGNIQNIQLSDLNGKILITFETDAQNISIPMRTFPKGMYFLKVDYQLPGEYVQSTHQKILKQ